MHFMKNLQKESLSYTNFTFLWATDLYMYNIIIIFFLIVTLENYLKAKKKIPVFPLTRPTLYFCADPVMFIAIKNEIKRFSCLPDPIFIP